MPTLTERHVKSARKRHYCDDCGRTITEGSPYVYLFGMAEVNDKPQSMHICPTCDERFRNLKAAAFGGKL